MELLTILNRCHHFRGFVYHRARFTPDHNSIEVLVRPRRGSAAICSRCHQPAPGYDQLPERRFEFIPFWGFFVFLLYAMRRVDCRRCAAVGVEEAPWGDDPLQASGAKNGTPAPRVYAAAKPRPRAKPSPSRIAFAFQANVLL